MLQNSGRFEYFSQYLVPIIAVSPSVADTPTAATTAVIGLKSY